VRSPGFGRTVLTPGLPRKRRRLRGACTGPDPWCPNAHPRCAELLGRDRANPLATDRRIGEPARAGPPPHGSERPPQIVRLALLDRWQNASAAPAVW
jgi:hypothetical protein